MIFSAFLSSRKSSAMVCLFCIRPIQNNKIQANKGIVIIPNKSAINRFPASPGVAVNAEITYAISKPMIAISAAMAVSRFGFFFIIGYQTFL